MKIKAIAAISVLVILAGCAGAGQIPPAPREITNQVTLETSFDNTWSALIQWFAINNTVLDRIDKENGLLTTERFLGASNGMLDCGEATGQISYASARIENPTANANIIVRNISDESTQVIISFFGQANSVIRNVAGGVVSSSYADCVSTGQIESELITYLKTI